MSVPSYLAKRIIGDPTPPEKLEAMRRVAWHRQGVALLSPDDDRLPWDVREQVRQAAEKLYGKRERKRT
jgi:hypothetical protein